MGVLGQPLRRLSALVAALCLTVGCAGEDAELDPLAAGQRYLEDRGYRRQVLEASFVDSGNGYASLRRSRYAVGEAEGWDALDEWNPPVRPITVDDVGRFTTDPDGPSDGPLEPVLTDADRPVDGAWTEAALLELGRRAFETYPVQLNASASVALETRALLDRHGLQLDDRGRIGGLVRVRLPDGREQPAVTCASCHARPDPDGGRLVHGRASRFDFGGLSHRVHSERGADPAIIAYLLDWGPGRVDVTPDGMHNPVAMSDLRPLSRQAHIHWAATLHNDLIALAIRIETLIITSLSESARPPREVALALAFYVWHLGDGRLPAHASAHPQGAALYERHCQSCHGLDERPDTARISLEDAGTETSVGSSITRGTGSYRVPSLWAIEDRAPLLHDGSVPDLEALLDPARLDESPGHRWGTGLSLAERAQLVAFVRTIGRAAD